MNALAKMDELKRGVVIFLVLAVLTGLEYVVAVLELEAVGVTLLTLIALAKAGLVLWFFMHVFRLWRDEEDHS